MSIAISVREYRGCERADVTVSTIALLAGLNGAGKSSFMDAAASALSQSPLPSFIKKKDAKLLVRRGADKAKVTAVMDKSAITVKLPDAELVSDGPPIRVSQYASGLVSVVDLSDRDRRKVLAEYLDAEPGEDDLRDALTDLDLKPETIKEIWEFIKLNGWDNAHTKWQEAGARAKGRWEQVTGEKYGSKKGASWLPQNWDEELGGATTTALADVVAKAKTDLETALKSTAVQEDRIEQLRADAANITKLTEDKERAQTKLTALTKTQDEAEAAYKALPKPPADESHPSCPHCGADVMVMQIGGGKYKLDKPKQLTAKQREKMDAALTEAHAKATEAMDAVSEAQVELNRISGALADATDAKAQLEKIEAQQKKGNTGADVEKCRETLAKAEGNLKAFQDERQATQLHTEIMSLAGIVNALAPDGLRKRRMTRAIEKFNAELLRPIAEKASFNEIKLDEELQPTYRGTLYGLASASEKFRVKTVLQIAMAMLDKSQVVLIDGADVLDQPGRNGLFEMLSKLTIPSIVAMTLSSPDKAPDLEQAGLGQTYWIMDGMCKPLRGGESSRQAAE